MLNHGNTLVQLLHCLSLTSCQLESTLPPAAQLLLSQSQQGDLVGYHLRLLTSLRQFVNKVMSRSTRRTLPAVNRKHLFMHRFCIEYFLPQETQNRTSIFGSILLKHCHYFDYWKQSLKMSMLVCYLDCHEAGLCCYLVIPVHKICYVLYSCFTSICELFTNCPSYFYLNECYYNFINKQM
jgi:hypothetical protein